ncbi:hypothetical protein CRG98_019260, partial [Punica granatum]
MDWMGKQFSHSVFLGNAGRLLEFWAHWAHRLTWNDPFTGPRYWHTPKAQPTIIPLLCLPRLCSTKEIQSTERQGHRQRQRWWCPVSLRLPRSAAQGFESEHPFRSTHAP